MLIDSESKLSGSFSYVLDTTFGTHKEIDNIAGTTGNQFLYFVFLFGNKAGKCVDLFTV